MDDANQLECQICLADFEVGDKICWSNNPDCVHTFHISCLEPWLLKHDECPLCRCPYLVPPKEDPPAPTASGADEEAPPERHVIPLSRQVAEALSRSRCHSNEEERPFESTRETDEGDEEYDVQVSANAHREEATSLCDDHVDRPSTGDAPSLALEQEEDMTLDPRDEEMVDRIDGDLDIENGTTPRQKLKKSAMGVNGPTPTAPRHCKECQSTTLGD